MKKNAVRAPISSDERLAIALRFLVSGESQASLSYYFKIGKTTVCGLVEEVCEALWKHKLKNSQPKNSHQSNSPLVNSPRKIPTQKIPT